MAGRGTLAFDEAQTPFGTVVMLATEEQDGQATASTERLKALQPMLSTAADNHQTGGFLCSSVVAVKSRGAAVCLCRMNVQACRSDQAGASIRQIGRWWLAD